MEQHYRKSSFREKLIEHLFVSELLKVSWLSGSCSLEVAKPEVDNQGYDLIIEENRIIRHVQLKASHRHAAAAKQKVHIGLGTKPSGCVVWVFFEEETMQLGPFLFLGSAPGLPLPSLEGFRVSKHTKGNSEGVKAERPDLRDIPKGAFTQLETVSAVYEKLFKNA